MIKRIDELPAVVTCFAYRQEYFAEMDGMLATLREYHPDWPVVVGRGPIPSFEWPTMEVESPFGKYYWSLPAALNLDDTENDWRKITRVKALWIAEVWRHLGGLADSHHNRLIWIDADARLNNSLDIELDPEAEIVAGPWWEDPENSDHNIIITCLLVFQGASKGIVKTIIDQWANLCLSDIRNLPIASTVPGFDSDQPALKEALLNFSDSKAEYTFLKLEADKYAGETNKDGTRLPGALIDQWQMNRKMKFPECRDRNWPPPEKARRRSAE